MANSPVTTPSVPNKQLYNGGSEWQNDYSNLPDYYATFNRNYDAATGRFVGVDPAAESAESMTSYQYAGNNPIMYNDPLGDRKLAPQDDPMSYNAPQGGGNYDIFADADAIDKMNGNYIAPNSFASSSNTGGGDYGTGLGSLIADLSDLMNDNNIGRLSLSGDAVRQGIDAEAAIESNPNYDFSSDPEFNGMFAGIMLKQVNISSWGRLVSSIQAEAYQTKFYRDSQGGYREFSGQKTAVGDLFGVSMEKNEYQGVVTIVGQDASYTLLARYGVRQLDSHHWTAWVYAYYIGPTVDDIFFNASTSLSINGAIFDSQDINSKGETNLTPLGWTYLGSAGYNFNNLGNLGNFGINVHVSVGAGSTSGNTSGTGYLNFTIPITKQ